MKARKLLCLALAIVMVMSLAIAGSAYTIEISKGTDTGKVAGHTYNVYQIFTGDLSKVDGKNVLSNLKFGSSGWVDGVSGAAAGTTVPAATMDKFKSGGAYASAENLAKAIVAWGKETDNTLTVYGQLVSPNYKLDDVPAGYYLIQDVTTSVEPGDSLSNYIVQVVEDLKINPKSEETKIIKTEFDPDLAEIAAVEAGLGSANAYEIRSTIAANAHTYKKYFFVLGDEMSTGLTFNNDIVVTIGGQTAAVGDDYVVYTPGVYKATNTFEVALINPARYSGQQVVVTYSATVNSDAVLTHEEENTAEVIYTRDPYFDYEEVPGKPGIPVHDNDQPIGELPSETPKVYQAKISILKVDENDNVLEFANFNLTSTDAHQIATKSGTAFKRNDGVADADAWYLLKDGTYTQTKPTGYSWEKIGVGDKSTTIGWILADSKVPDDALQSDGLYYVPGDTDQYNGKTLYKKVNPTNKSYASMEKYEKFTFTDRTNTEAPVDWDVTTGADGKAAFDLLGAGHYVLTETLAPTGYNYMTPNPITFDLVFHNASENFTIENANTQYTDMGNGYEFQFKIIDQTGSVLPETGGMGTTLFYVIGSICVIGAAILLVTKKRMSVVD